MIIGSTVDWLCWVSMGGTIGIVRWAGVGRLSWVSIGAALSITIVGWLLDCDCWVLVD